MSLHQLLSIISEIIDLLVPSTNFSICQRWTWQHAKLYASNSTKTYTVSSSHWEVKDSNVLKLSHMNLPNVLNLN